MLKKYVKKHFSSLYSLGRSVRDASKNNKKLKALEKLYNATHTAKVEADYPLATIYVNDSPNRLNLVFRDFHESKMSDDAHPLLEIGTTFAKKYNYHLRIVSRNSLINPCIYLDFLKARNLKAPEKYSFYTDSMDRVSSPARRLDVGRNDVFFTEKDLIKLKQWIKNNEK